LSLEGKGKNNQSKAEIDEKKIKISLEMIRVAKVRKGCPVLSRFRPTVNIPLIPLLSHPDFGTPRTGHEHNH
jgi:hypothetical protein